MPKSEETRSLIVTTAMRLFTENGYDRTTMRAIAAEAGVSVGNAYYYFSSKEQLIQGFYDEIARLHLDAARALLVHEPRFAERLKAVLLCWLELAEPYHRFGTQFFVNAADPESPLSPFSDESAAARDASIELMREVVDGSDVKLDPELRAQLPELLWLFQMGVVLFWVHDRSAREKRSRMLVERSVPLLARLAALSRLRVFRPVSREIVDLIQDLAKRD
ncbi:TetR family transcriptional regulator [Amycolatopsis sp., V23-08]|uniref:TetR family transcriptional regulator n=1 Tax=Amycolatopsis heterodermiae TaxID=3110235 RepID=A0ABU5RM18_9PSEU|nr:TetR family transcriptional regulator [Amycolatopsis sp., V23-08]MEA5366171.1 TetR family transcriptional regulator [Amycolatopsis sp., V23-08]